MPRKPSAIAPQIIDQAAEWFVALRDGVTEEERAAFVEWLCASPVHVQAYLEIGELWTDAKQVSAHVSADAPAAASNLLSLREGAPVATPRSDTTPRLAHGGLRRLAWAASVVGVCVLAAAVWWWARPREYATDVAEQRVITIADGSVVKLDARSHLSVRMSPRLREIHLLAGQAYFEVAHDATRPFIVRGGNVAVQAVGTEFDVDLRTSGTVVSVLEGRVAVSPASAPVSAPGESATIPTVTLVAAGEQLTRDPQGALKHTSPSNIAAATSWTQQELIFQGEPLNDVIETMNRYSRMPIVLADPSLGDLRISAVFHSTSPEPLLHFIGRLDGVTVERADDAIRIRRRT